jgi:hypothetical protein
MERRQQLQVQTEQAQAEGCERRLEEEREGCVGRSMAGPRSEAQQATTATRQPGRRPLPPGEVDREADGEKQRVDNQDGQDVFAVALDFRPKALSSGRAGRKERGVVVRARSPKAGGLGSRAAHVVAHLARHFG